MSIKVGDRVLYKGYVVRLMTNYESTILLSHFGFIDCAIDNLTLIESIVLPKLAVGDLVIVNDISQEEKNDYIVRWNGEKDYIIDSKTPYKIDVIEDTEHYGLIVKINDQWFLPYHITPTINYDMI